MKESSHWNYRVVAIPDGVETYFRLQEVYYTGRKAHSTTEGTASVGGNSLEEIEGELRRMKDALKKPILWGDDRFPEEYKIPEEGNKVNSDVEPVK